MDGWGLLLTFRNRASGGAGVYSVFFHRNHYLVGIEQMKFTVALTVDMGLVVLRTAPPVP